MEYENMRVAELKSLARDRGLRNYSRMRKAELVVFLPFGFELFSTVWGKRPPINLYDISICVGE